MAFPDLGEGDIYYTSSGVPFEYDFAGYKEQFTNRATNAMIKTRLAWDDAVDFLPDVLGYTTGQNGQTTFNRYLPLAAPGINTLWCTDATLMGYPSSKKSNANQPSTFTPPFSVDWAIYQLTFTRLPYFVVDNADVADEVIPELARYVVPAWRPRARELTVNSYSLIVEATGVPLKQPAFVMDREQDLFLTLVEVPMELYPSTGIDACLGTINNTAMNLPISFDPPNSFTTRNFGQDTLLFRGVAQDIHAYQGPNGNWYQDIPYYMTYRPGGWRKLQDPVTPHAQVVVKYGGGGPAKYLYERTEFNQLFRPEP